MSVVKGDYEGSFTPGEISAARRDDARSVAGNLTIRNVLELITPDRDTSWHSKASCLGLDPNLFYPEQGENHPEARATCAQCPVKDKCLEDALANGEKFGIWGGTSVRERDSIKTQRTEPQLSAARSMD